MTLLTAAVLSVPVLTLFAGSVALFVKEKAMPSVLQLFGGGCLVVVVLAHICEAVPLFPAMGWGLENSPGHYLDLGGAGLGLALFPLGYLLHILNLKPR